MPASSGTSLAFLGIAGTTLPTPLWYWLRDEVGHLTLFLFLVPAFGLAIAALVFGERLSWLELVALAVIILGVLLLGLTGARKPASRQSAHGRAAIGKP